MIVKPVPILDQVRNEGIDLSKRGKVYMGLCPFHSEKTPSFSVYPETGRFYCYGCQEKGDAIDFIRKLKGISFPEALTYLGIEGDSRYGKHIKDKGIARRRALIKAFERWRIEYYCEMANSYQMFRWLTTKIKTEDDLEQYGYVYHKIVILEYRMDILFNGDDKAKMALFKEVMVNGS